MRLPFARRLPEALLTLIGIVFVIRFVWANNREVSRVADGLATQGLTIAIAGGDVSLRDAPIAHELAHAHFFSDPYYEGETSWYPFVTPLAAAVASRLLAVTIPEAYFRVEPLFIGVFVVAAAALAFRVSRWCGVAALACALLLQRLPIASGIYPADAARGPFLALLLLIGHAARAAPAWRPHLAAGVLLGTLGVWHGASFFVGIGLVTLFAVVPIIWRTIRRRSAPRAEAAALTSILFGAAVPMAILLLPQLLHYGTIQISPAARRWVEPGIYGDGGLDRAWASGHWPSLLTTMMIAVLVVREVVAKYRRRPGSLEVRMLTLALTASLLAGHMGFLIADRTSPDLARLARMLLPAPSHTFLSVAESTSSVAAVLGFAAIVEGAGRIAARLLRGHQRLVKAARVPGIVGALGVCAFVSSFAVVPLRKYLATEKVTFVAFAEKVGSLAGHKTVFFRHPGRFTQHAPIKILVLSLDYYANPYVHARRVDAARALDQSLQRRDFSAADRVLHEAGIQFIMENPRHRNDLVVRSCSGDVAAEFEGFILRRVAPCRG